MITNSLSFPYMFDSTTKQVRLIEDTAAVSNRAKLLMLTDPKELVDSIDYGVGLRRWLYKYNIPDKVVPEIAQRVKDQLAIYEPYCISEKTKITLGLMETGEDAQNANENVLKFTVQVFMPDNREATVTGEYVING